MKTRVVRHWSNTDWIYTVEIFEQVKSTDVFLFRIDDPQSEALPAPEIGSWRWRLYIIPNGGAPGLFEFSRDRATSIAWRLAEALSQEDADVIAEFGS